MSRGQKTLVGVGVVAVIAVIGFMSVRNSQGRGVEVRFEEITRRDLVATVTANGYVRARVAVDISADVSGRIVELNIDEGDDVTEGEVLLRIDATGPQAALSRARAQLSQARAQAAQQEASLVRSRRDSERSAALWARDSTLISRQQVEDARTDFEVGNSLLESARFGVEQAVAGVDEAQDRLSKTTIRAPITGKVTRLSVEQGETAVIGTMNNPGSLLLTVSDLSVVEAVMEVDETDVPEITIGDFASIELDAFPDVEFTGQVTEIGNSAIRPPSQNTTGQSQTIDFEVVITLDDPPEELRPDLSATAEVIIDTRDNALSVPIIAVTVRDTDGDDNADEGDGESRGSSNSDSEQQEGVFVVTNGEAKFVPITIGIAGQDYFEVLTGLEGGEIVVAGPYQAVRNLSDGDPVTELEGSGNGDAPNSARGSR